MATSKKGSGWRSGLQKPKKANWVRSGGAFGDPSMDEAEAFNQSGAGVSEEVKAVDTDPNEDLGHGKGIRASHARAKGRFVEAS